MITIDGKYLAETWESIVRRIFADGVETSPRGMKTKELTHVSVHFDRVVDYTFFNPVRRANPVMHLVEMLYFLNGRDDDVLAVKWLKGMDAYLNQATRRFDGGYGPQICASLPFVFAELKRDPDTRRAAFPIATPAHVRVMSSTNDYPCNPFMGFNLRHGELNMWVLTRSQDVMQGYIYDQLEFRFMQAMMAQALDVVPGSFDHHVVSCHLYERDWERAAACLGKDPRIDTRTPAFPFSGVDGFWRYVRSFNGVIDCLDADFDSEDDVRSAIVHYAGRKTSAFPIGELGPFTSWLNDWAALRLP